jgi:hypothetical protein
LHLFKKCSWSGLKNGLKEHAKAEHPRAFLNVSSFPDMHLSSSWALVSHFGELFTFHKQKRDGRYFCAVQLIGKSSEASKYKYELTLRATNGIEQISKTFLIQGYSEDFETIFDSGMCPILDDKTVQHFAAEEKLKMYVKLSRV